MDREFDQIAQEIYNAPYEKLSAWGKIVVEEEYKNRNPVKDDTIKGPHSVGLDNHIASLEIQLDREKRINEQLRWENMELWEENQDLKKQ